MKLHVFLSHSHADYEWAGIFQQHGEPLDIAYYLFEHDNNPGARLVDKIRSTIRMSHAFVVLLTPNSVYAPFVREEIGIAIEANKLIVPVLFPGVLQDHLAFLQGLECVHVDPNNPHASVSTLNDFLSRQKRSNEATLAIGLGIGAALAIWAATKSE